MQEDSSGKQNLRKILTRFTELLEISLPHTASFRENSNISIPTFVSAFELAQADLPLENVPRNFHYGTGLDIKYDSSMQWGHGYCSPMLSSFIYLDDWVVQGMKTCTDCK